MDFFLPKKINAWHQASIYGKNAIEYFSYQVGPYPYDQVSIVECQKAGADGMEYPMITLIDRYYNLPENLEEVILHELGHNWFQAVLATDEREEAWLDEGLVTFYEHKYFQKRPMSPFIGHGLFTLNSDYDVPPDFYGICKQLIIGIWLCLRRLKNTLSMATSYLPMKNRPKDSGCLNRLLENRSLNQ